jgi:hypothetical protein
VVDLESTRLGRWSLALPFEFLFGIIDLKSPVSQGTYGRTKSELISEEVLLGKAIPVSDGILVLEIQAKILDFLLGACSVILHDKKPLFDDSSIPTQPQPESLPDPNHGEWASIWQLTIERPYTVPKKVNLSELLSLAQAALDQSRDHTWPLREDPGYFSRVAHDYLDHLPEKMLDLSGREHPDITDPTTQTRLWKRFYNILCAALTSLRETGRLSWACWRK